MKHFTIFDIRGPWALAGRNRRQADTAIPAAGLDVCQLSTSVRPANAASPCGFLSTPY